MFRLRQLNAEMVEFEKNKDNSPEESLLNVLPGAIQLLGSDQLTLHECQTAAAAEPGSMVPLMTMTTVESPVINEHGRRIRPQANEASDRQLCVVMTEESSSKR